MRLESTHTIKLGDIATCHNGFKWVCGGWTEVGEGRSSFWVRDVSGLHGTNKLRDRLFTKTFATTENFNAFFTDGKAFAK